MRVGNGLDTEYNIFNSNVRMHEINISTKPIKLLNKWILNYLVLLYVWFNDIFMYNIFC